MIVSVFVMTFNHFRKTQFELLPWRLVWQLTHQIAETNWIM